MHGLETRNWPVHQTVTWRRGLIQQIVELNLQVQYPEERHDLVAPYDRLLRPIHAGQEVAVRMPGGRRHRRPGEQAMRSSQGMQQTWQACSSKTNTI